MMMMMMIIIIIITTTTTIVSCHATVGGKHLGKIMNSATEINAARHDNFNLVFDPLNFRLNE